MNDAVVVVVVAVDDTAAAAAAAKGRLILVECNPLIGVLVLPSGGATKNEKRKQRIHG